MSENNHNNLSKQNDSMHLTQLHGTGSNLHGNSLTNQLLSRLNEEQLQNIAEKAVLTRIEQEKNQFERDDLFYQAKKDVELHVNAVNALNKGGKIIGDKVTLDIKTGAGNMRIESRSGGVCFVATTAYGSTDHPNVIYLRNFRDKVLINSNPGILFVKWYWKYGPKLARVVDQSETLKMITRSFIVTLVYFLRKRTNF